ncbi:MAG: hypothetical protein WKF73_07670 [Nocardioidaceae bacterium]
MTPSIVKPLPTQSAWSGGSLVNWLPSLAYRLSATLMPSKCNDSCGRLTSRRLSGLGPRRANTASLSPLFAFLGGISYFGISVVGSFVAGSVPGAAFVAAPSRATARRLTCPAECSSTWV